MQSGQPGAPAAAPPPAPAAFDLLSPADAAKLLGVSEADVIASLEAGILKVKRSGPFTALPAPRWRSSSTRERSHRLKKFHCPACGAEAQWNPASQALVCPFCGTVAPGELDGATGTIREHDLVTRLREFAETHRDWKQSGSQ